MKFRGVNYGHYRGTGPFVGETVALEQVHQDLKIMQQLGVTDLRTYWLKDGLETIPELSKDYDITTAVVAVISPERDDRANFDSIDHGLAFETDSSMTILGNEVLFREEYSPEEFEVFINYANDHRAQASKIALAEPYNILLGIPSLVEQVSTLMVHIYPAWDGISLDDAAQYTVDKFLKVRKRFPDKELYLGEFGWPSGPAGQFSEKNQKRYFQELYPLLEGHGIDSYLFEIFDEPWKSEVIDETYEVGPYWGVFDVDREAKPAAEEVIAQYFGGRVE